jgi:hypothetical protein
MDALCAGIEGVGVLGPGLDGWAGAAPILGGTAPLAARPTVLPPAAGLPSVEQRRAGRVVRLALGAAFEAAAHARVAPAALRSVFASSGGDGDICHQICQTLAGPAPLLSPTAFHNSVHNAAAGYFGIASHAVAASTALCAFDASFAAGLLEALTQLRAEPTPLLLVAYDSGYPEPMHAKRPLPEPFAIALVLVAGAGTLATLRARRSSEPPTPLSEPQLEQWRASSPAARGLPLLRALARREAARVLLEYLEGSLALELEPCH